MTIQRGIRGAITVDQNSAQAIKDSTIELLQAIMGNNFFELEDVSHVIFTMTKDLNAAFPAKFARDELFGWNNIPMMCFNELDVEDSLKMCLRALVVINTNKKQNEIKHIYLKGAKKLRPDIN